MKDYDGKAQGDYMGSNNGRGARAGSLMGEFFPEDVRAKSMGQPGEIDRGRYPDTADAIYNEQEGNVRMAEKGRASGMYRK